MTKKILLSFCLFSGLSFGQSFTAANEPAIGTTQTLFLCDSASTNYASIKGDGVVWDYSNLQRFNDPGGIARNFKFEGNLKPAVFTNASKTKTSDEPLSFYFSSNSNESFIEGFEFQDASFGLVTVNLTSDNMKVMTYPFSFNSEVKDAFNGKLVVGSLVNTSCSGNSTSVIDGRGKIMLGNGVEINNVVRHNLDFSLSALTILGAVNVKVKQYEYYDLANSNLPVFTHTNLDIIQGTNTLIKMNFVFNSVEPNAASGLEENAYAKLVIAPNPVQDILTISGQFVSSIQIADLSGKILKTVNDSSINVSEFNSGVYFVLVEKNGVSYRQKFVKE